MAKNESNNMQGQNLKEEQQVDEMIANAVALAAKGENIEQLLEVILESFPNQVKDKIRKKFAASLTKKGIRAPATDADIPSRGTFARIRDMLAQSARQAMDRITSLVRSKPDVAASIAQAGKILMKNGVIIDRVQVSEAELGTMAPATTIGKGQSQGQGTGGRAT